MRNWMRNRTITIVCTLLCAAATGIPLLSLASAESLPTHTPKVCVGFDPDKRIWGDIGAENIDLVGIIILGNIYPGEQTD